MPKTHKDSECLGIKASPTEYNSNKKKEKVNDGRNVAFKAESENGSEDEKDKDKKLEVKVDRALTSFVRETSDMV
jgi:hypothetical protein